MKLRAFVISFAMLITSVFYACESKEKYESAGSSNSIIISETALSETAKEICSELDFDFNSAIQNIELFGNVISLPCTFDEFGPDFELYEDISIPFSDTSKLTVMIKYKGKFVGSVVLDDCRLEDENKIQKQVVCLTLGDSMDNISKNSNWYNDIIQLEFSGISFSSTETEVKEKLGTPTFRVGEYFDDRLAYDKSETEYLRIKFKEGEIVEFNLCVK